MVIAYHADHATRESYASRRLLALEANVSSSTVHLALEELLAAGEIEILLTGSGRKATTYRICSDSPIESLQPVDNSVATRSAARSDSICDPVATRSAGASIGGTEDQNKIEPQPAAATSVPDGPTADAADRHSVQGNGIPEDAVAAIATLKAELTAQAIVDRETERQRQEKLWGPPSTEPRAREPPAA